MPYETQSPYDFIINETCKGEEGNGSDDKFEPDSSSNTIKITSFLLLFILLLN